MCGIGQLVLCLCALTDAPPANVAPGFSVCGTWIYGGLASHTPGKITIYARQRDAAAVWNPQIKTPGKYRVSLYSPAHPSNDPRAKVTVVHAGTSDECRMDQAQQPAGWIALGEFAFSGQGSEYVRLSLGTSGKLLRAAAAKFEFRGAPGENLWSNLILDGKSMDVDWVRVYRGKE